MMRSFLAILGFMLVLLAQVFTLQNCATPSSPVGGARDTLGPVLVEDATTPNFQTNFKPEEIVLTFDEWVEQDLKQKILISPPLELGEDNVPYLKRKSLIIPLQGLELRDSVTYVINIGSAIKDLHEGNPTENLRFVFATGPVLDSASVSGVLVEDFTGNPIDDATFTLYSNLADTATTTENPTYFAQTDEEGKFTVFNIRPGQYRAIGLVRNPGATNYYVDLEGTFKPVSIGFPDTLITVADGPNEIGSLRLSALPLPIKIIGRDTSDYGAIKITFNQPAENIDLQSRRTDYLRRNDKDTLKLFYREIAADTLLFGKDSIFTDTLLYAGTAFLPGDSLRVATPPSGRLNPAEGVNFVFNRPIASIDTTLISLIDKADTLATPLPYQFSLDSIYPGKLNFQARWQANATYQLEILPGAISDWTAGTNADTLSNSFRADDPEKYGILTLKFTELDSTQRYIIRLVEKEDPLPNTQRHLDQLSSYEIIYRGLKPATYQLEVIYDTNGNGRYDAGDFVLDRQPERVRRFDLEKLRANWEVEEDIDLSEE